MNSIALQSEEDELDKIMLGQQLSGGWAIQEVRHVQRDAPGRCRTYLARNAEGRAAFVKVLDPRGFGSLEEQQQTLDLFIYEKDLVEKCAGRNMRRVIRGLESGDIVVPGILSIRVRYLVFEWADLDIRSHYEPDEAKHVATSLRWLHHSAVALHELHYSKITHEEVKPSHVLVMPEGDAKLGGFARARDQERPKPAVDFGRDPVWAPPEVLYGRQVESFEDRCAADMYQLGSLAIFMITSVGLNAALQRKLSSMHSWTQWNGSFEDVLLYLRSAYDQVIDEFAEQVPVTIRNRLVTLVRQLTDPDPALRGHPTNRRGVGPRYGFERFISEFDLLLHEAMRRRPAG
jgi:eukaryotic-like serine/threonine-protein kinase